MSYSANLAFRGIRALYGEKSFEKFRNSSVLVIGIGGVGSWIAEALCRTGIGSLTLIDSDLIEISNTNRQSHTLISSYGKPKVEELSARFKQINPEIKINAIQEKITIDNCESILADCPQYIAEAIDDIEAKACIANYLYKNKKTFICAGGAGGRIDPSFLSIGDIALAKGDALIARLRNILRKEYGFPKGGEKMHIMCTYSNEKPVYSQKDAYVSGDLPAFGASMAVTATAGMLAASWLIKQISDN